MVTFFPPQEKLPESIVLLDDTKRPLRLDRTIHPELDAFRAGDPFQRCCPLRNEFLVPDGNTGDGSLCCYIKSNHLA